jgi:hypothetical protein
MAGSFRFTAIAAALMAGSSLAHAQTFVPEQPVDTVIAQQPAVIVTQPPPVVSGVPLRTVETVRTVRSTTTPRRNAAGRLVRSVTTTRTTVSERAVAAPLPATTSPALRAITQPGYTEIVQDPGLAAAYHATYPAPLYDVVGPLGLPPPTGVLAQPVDGNAVISPAPAYRYIYEPDRILVIDANTGIAVQAMPR